MTYLVEIKETAQSKPLIEHLKTLKYVKLHREKGIPDTDGKILKELKKSEKSKRVKWDEAKKQINAWK